MDRNFWKEVPTGLELSNTYEIFFFKLRNNIVKLIDLLKFYFYILFVFGKLYETPLIHM